MSDATRRRRRFSHARLAPVNRFNNSMFELEPFERRVLLASVAGSVFHDINGNGTRDTGEGGLPGWTVFLDANQNGSLEQTSHDVPGTDTPRPVPDFPNPPATSAITVSGVGTVGDINVSVNLAHTFNADLEVFLISPAGTRIELFTDIGGNGDGINVTLDQEAAVPIASQTQSAVITGTFRPEADLSILYNQPADGTWTLEVGDDTLGQAGTLQSWTLSLRAGERSAVTRADGTYTFLNAAPGTYDARQVTQPGWNQTAPAGGFHTLTLDASSNITGIDFGNRQPPGTISGFVFSDYDSDGAIDAGEPGLTGWTVFLDQNNNSLLDAGETSAVSGANGSYTFSDLLPGQYVVREVLQPGYAQTVPGSGGVILGGGPDAAGDDDGGGNADRPFTATEIVVAFKGTIGRGALKKEIQSDRALAQLVDYVKSSDMFTVRGVTLVEVKLRAGADPQRVAERFASKGKVKWAQPNYIYDEFDPREFTPNDELYGNQYHHPLMQNDLAWDTTLGAPSVLIGITDDGYMLNHPDLQQNYYTNPNEIPGNNIDDDGNGFIDDVSGWDVWNNDNNPSPAVPSDDHGTHVAGIAAGRTNNGTGIAGTAGGSTVVPIRFWGGSGWTSNHVSTAYRYATDIGCKIVSTSYNVDGFASDNIFAAALNYMYDNGVLHFNSAGNNDEENPLRQKFDQSLYVANTDANDHKNSSSNYGWGIDIAAPGTSILSTAIGSNLSQATYEVKSGTSMATPNAAAVAALIWSAHPTWTREQVAAQLIGSADNIDADNPMFAGKLGSGRVNAFRALGGTIAPPRVKALAGLPAEGGTTFTQPLTFTMDLANVFDPTTMNGGAFEMRGAGIDGIFDTGDDRLVPLTVLFGGSSTTDYKFGTNRVFLFVAGAMPTGTYRLSLKTTAADPFGQPVDGNGDGTGGDAYARTFTYAAPSNRYVVMLDAGEVVSDVNFGNHDVVTPKVLSASFAFATSQRIIAQFNEDVSASLSLADLTLLNTTTNTPVDLSGFTLSWNGATNTATIDVNGILADANYRATFSAAGIADPSGNALDGDGNGTGGDDFAMTFFFLNGDANHDRIVNLSDFNMLAANFGQSGRDFTQGDFNYDGTVNLSDFNILASRFGTTLGESGDDEQLG